MEILLSICLGIGLGAACGFRVFVPLLAMSIASLSGHLTLSQGFQWIGTYSAFIAFGTATILEITAYYIPWIDNLLDSIAAPASMIAGTIVAASSIVQISPLMKWTLAIIAGGGTAAIFHGAHCNNERCVKCSYRRHRQSRRCNNRTGACISSERVGNNPAACMWLHSCCTAFCTDKKELSESS